MKKLVLSISIALIIYSSHSYGQIAAAEAVKLVVKKVIKAIDLKVQRMQNKTIWLQNAQKVLENEMSKYRLEEIQGWTEKQRRLYDEYYQELWKVKGAIAYYQRIKDLSLRQVKMINEYRRAWQLIRADTHFRAEEIAAMSRVYLGILDASAKNLDQIMMVINPGKTQMTDQQRLEAINLAGDRLDENYGDLKQFNNQNIMLSLQREKDLNEIQTIRRYYGLH
ncbi:MAG: conjugal transfer protein TraI [Mucilaginibacter sp.]|nr:conjugal transfer protein TraI [Mucilaginibacter sp.]